MDPQKVVQQIITKHGPVLDLRKNPTVIIDIIRSFGRQLDLDDGGLPGGVPPAPPPGPTSFQGHVGPDDIMREVLKLSRAVEALSRQMKGH